MKRRKRSRSDHSQPKPSNQPSASDVGEGQTSSKPDRANSSHEPDETSPRPEVPEISGAPNGPSTREDPLTPEVPPMPEGDPVIGRVKESPSAGKQVLFPQLPSLSRIMSVVMLMFGILAVGVLFYQLMIGFFVPLFLAALLVVIFRPVHLWILKRTGGRGRVSAALTTTVVLLVVLMPLGMLVSIATTQFTVLLSQMNGSMSVALDRVRSQLGLDLPHAEHFRQLDRTVDLLGIAEPVIEPAGAGGEVRTDLIAKAKQLDQAASIIAYLQDDLPSADTAVDEADNAISSIKQFADGLRAADQMRRQENESGMFNPLTRLNVSEQFEKQAVFTAAAIRTWMNQKLGGTLQSQLKLLANPDETDFARLIRGARESLQPRFVRLTSATGSIVAQTLFGLVILIIAVYFFLIDGPAMITTLMRLSPMDDAYEHQLLMEFDRTSRAVVLASVLSAVVQGILATIAFWIAGFDQIILLLFLTSLMALVPFLGAASVWVPCALWLAVVEQRMIPAILLAIWGAAVVSSIDNVIKVYVLHGRSQLHPLFALLSVIGGVSVFGPIGILVGPMVVVFLQTLLEILNHELHNESSRSASS